VVSPLRAASLKFRHNSALTVAGAVALIGAMPLALSKAWLSPLLLVPLAVAVWGWRAGTDADSDGLRVRALFGAQQVPWRDVSELVPDGHGHLYARLADGALLRLPAVPAHQAAQVAAASGALAVPEAEGPAPSPAAEGPARSPATGGPDGLPAGDAAVGAPEPDPPS
jgi:hypothetical protein